MNIGRRIFQSNAPGATVLIRVAVGGVFLSEGIQKFLDPWSMAHEARTDVAMLLSSVFLLLVGAGPWAIDQRLGETRP